MDPFINTHIYIEEVFLFLSLSLSFFPFFLWPRKLGCGGGLPISPFELFFAPLSPELLLLPSLLLLLLHLPSSRLFRGKQSVECFPPKNNCVGKRNAERSRERTDTKMKGATRRNILRPDPSRPFSFRLILSARKKRTTRIIGARHSDLISRLETHRLSCRSAHRRPRRYECRRTPCPASN